MNRKEVIHSGSNIVFKELFTISPTKTHREQVYARSYISAVSTITQDDHRSYLELGRALIH